MPSKPPIQPYQLTALRENLERFTGPEVREQVMQGSQEITTSTNPVKIARWMKNAVEKLEELVDEETCSQVLLYCGYHCAKVHKIASQARKHRRKYPALEEYLEAGLCNPARGTRMERQGDIIYQYYTPQSLSRPVRCYCSLLRKLPEGENAPLAFCQCSRGFAQKVWEAVLGRPVQIEILESCAAGARECKFAIHLIASDFTLTP